MRNEAIPQTINMNFVIVDPQNHIGGKFSNGLEG